MRLANIFGDRFFFKSVGKIAFPVAIGQLLTSTLSLVDSLMIGTLGENELAAVGMAGQYVGLNWSLCWGIIAGGILFFAQYWGAKDIHGIHKASSVSFLSCILVTLVLSMFALFCPITVMEIYTNDPVINEIGARYLRIVSVSILFNIFVSWAAGLLRSTENVKLPLIASIASLATNTFLNWIFIYGKLGFPALGVEGAAIATLAATAVNAFIMLGVSAKHGNILINAMKNLFAADFAYIKEFYKKATPIVINEAFYGIAVLFINMTLGRQGADNLSALAIFRTIEGFVFAFYQGLANAATVIVGKSIGAGNIREGIRDARRLSILSPVLTIITCLFIYLIRYQITGLYKINDNIQNTVFAMLFIYIFMATLRTTNYLMIGIYRAGGESKLGMYFEVGGIWLLGVPLVALTGLVLHAPFVVVFIMLYAEDIAKIGIEYYFLLKNKWIKPVTPEGKEGVKQFLAEKAEFRK